MAWISGDKLTLSAQRIALSSFVHRFTGNHIPAWSKQEWKDGKTYPLQFKDDQDWLNNTLFAITVRGTLDKRVDHCFSTPTWPNNPELRTLEAA